MATWIVHLRIAENLLERIEGLDPAYFAIGNLAPDSGVPDENWEHFNPPPEVLHFKNSASDGWSLADLDFYRQYIDPHKANASDTRRLSFLHGYFFHLVIDNLWREQIVKPLQERYTAEFEKDKGFIWQVKRDWYGLDFEYVRTNPGCLFWRVFLQSQYEGEFLDFLPGEFIRQRMNYIKEFYQRKDVEIEEWYIRRPDQYLTKLEWEAFIERNTDRLEKIHGRLQDKGAENLKISSSLSIEMDGK
jgi:hypothetical protein